MKPLALLLLLSLTSCAGYAPLFDTPMHAPNSGNYWAGVSAGVAKVEGTKPRKH